LAKTAEQILMKESLMSKEKVGEEGKVDSIP
jgi:hypothetical protein